MNTRLSPLAASGWPPQQSSAVTPWNRAQRDGLLQRLRSAWAEWRDARARRARRAQTVAAIGRLDDATLRDLGLHRSEAASCWAEAENLVEQTRLHVLARRMAGQ